MGETELVMEKMGAESVYDPAHLQLYLSFKRGTDIVIAFVILLIPMVVIGILIEVDSPGPVLFKQERLGKDGKPFMIYKFRSMGEGAEKDGPKWADKNDERCTRVGKVLRKSRLDELPQLLNILKGDMSLVGTRPPTLDEWEKYEPHHRARMAFRPGLTGMWQVSGRSNITDFEEVVRLDTEYIDAWTFGLDIKILFKTVKTVFKNDGAM